MKSTLLALVGSTAIVFTACKTGGPNSEWLSSENLLLLSTPAAIGSGEANLFTSEDNEVFLTWIDEEDGYNKLRYSKFSGTSWKEPVLIAEGDNWFVNWADFPSMAVAKNGNMAAHYLFMNGEGTFAYSVNLVFSNDNGNNWINPVIPHETVTNTEHGFVSLVPYEKGFFAAWLDGRNTGGGHGHEDGASGAMTLRAAFIGSDGKVQEDMLLDSRTCDCCQTSAVITKNGPVVAYRDRSEEEIRDIYIVRWTGSGWSDPERIYKDNWQIEGCPVNGPVLAAKEDNLAIAWFTAPDQKSEIKLAFSKNGGETFQNPVRIDNGYPIGRIDMQMIDDLSVYITWMEARDEIAQIMVAHYTGTGILMDQFELTENKSDRASGFPRMGSNGDKVIIVWRDMTSEPEIKSAFIKI